MSAGPTTRRHDRGQSSVEFALVLPLVFVLVLAIAQIGLVIAAKLSVTHTAREVARAVSIDRSLDPATVAAQTAPLALAELNVVVEWRPGAGASGQIVVVTVAGTVPRVGGPWAPDLAVSTTVTMLGESGA